MASMSAALVKSILSDSDDARQKAKECVDADDPRSRFHAVRLIREIALPLLDKAEAAATEEEDPVGRKSLLADVADRRAHCCLVAHLALSPMLGFLEDAASTAEDARFVAAREEHLRKVIELRPDSPTAWLNLGNAVYRDNILEAAAAFEKVVAMDGTGRWGVQAARSLFDLRPQIEAAKKQAEQRAAAERAAAEARAAAEKAKAERKARRSEAIRQFESVRDDPAALAALATRRGAGHCARCGEGFSPGVFDRVARRRTCPECRAEA